MENVMGRAVVLVFFLLGFAVFAFIKFATVGVKAAYNAVNEKNDTDLTTESKISNVVVGILEVQMRFAGKKPGNLPKDDFVLGYVVGNVMAIQQQQNGMDSSAVDSFAILTLVFNLQFGMTKGATLLRRFLDNQQNMPEKMKSGVMAGGQDMLDFLSDRGPPMGLWKYISKKEQI
jgi:mannose/fructose/N-acetylgalactosamine-specific phosphotransferase system component IIC